MVCSKNQNMLIDSCRSDGIWNNTGTCNRVAGYVEKYIPWFYLDICQSRGLTVINICKTVRIKRPVKYILAADDRHSRLFVGLFAASGCGSASNFATNVLKLHSKYFLCEAFTLFWFTIA